MSSEMITLYNYILWFLFYSFVGWVYESILCSVDERKLINRGFLNGPYCPIYGSGAIAMIVCLRSQTNIITIFLLGALLACTIEYITSWVLEKLFHARWWDYTPRKFNIKGRICLIGAVVFGLFSVFLIKIVHPYIVEWTYKIPTYIRVNITLALSVLIMIDFVVTVINIVKFNEKLHQAQIEINTFIKESIDRAEEVKKTIEETIPKAGEIKKIIQETIPKAGEVRKVLEESFEGSAAYADKVKKSIEENIKNNKSNEYIKALVKKLNYQEKHILKAFPHFKSTKYSETLEKLKEAIKRKI
ncbi:MAG: hypothetical protein SO128_00125 [Clostridium cadaveris]|uniref:putative ABC transporter permease n=1 Tax=Clostridium cadaveris TaxID=1529 RepID=UPI002A864769|nr:hypothetical protein [Clostridium cadaveris]